MAATAEHRPQTFLFADISGYTALTEAHGDEHAADVVGDFGARIRSLLPRHGATEVKLLGDGVMLHASDAAAGVLLGRRIVDDIGSRHAFPTVRVGIHTGTAVERDGDWFGNAVNITSRIADVAAEREVLVSAATREAAAESIPDIDFVPAGYRRLKNVAEPIEVFRIVVAGAVLAEAFPADPVCRMIVDPERAAATETYQGREYRFCSDRCHDVFMRHPSLYASPHRSGGHVLVSDGARDRVVKRLGRAFLKGRLTADELDARVERAYGSRTRGELRTLTRDLPRRRRPVRWWRFLLPWWWFRRRRRRSRRPSS